MQKYVPLHSLRLRNEMQLTKGKRSLSGFHKDREVVQEASAVPVTAVG